MFRDTAHAAARLSTELSDRCQCLRHISVSKTPQREREREEERDGVPAPASSRKAFVSLGSGERDSASDGDRNIDPSMFHSLD